MKMVYHYAPWATVPAIVESDCLHPSNAGAANEMPLLWLSAHQTWEPTATKMMLTEAGPQHPADPAEMAQVWIEQRG